MVCSTHWSNIHHTLLNALPDKNIIQFHHTVTDFDQPEGSNKVKVTAEVGEDKKPKAFEGDFLVACDGSMSSVRAKFRPHDKRRCSLLHLTMLVIPCLGQLWRSMLTTPWGLGQCPTPRGSISSQACLL